MLIEPFFLPIKSFFTTLSARSANGSVGLLAKMGGFLKKRAHYRFDKITQYPGLKNA
jgi:hypothetical protein